MYSMVISHKNREVTLQTFKSGQLKRSIATNVAVRGVDMPEDSFNHLNKSIPISINQVEQVKIVVFIIK